MPLFLNIAIGETKTDDGIRVVVRDDGEQAWFHGKWLDLGLDHAVAWVDGKAVFRRADGKEFLVGSFPAWTVRSTRSGGASALMFNAAQFFGGELIIRDKKSTRRFAIDTPDPLCPCVAVVGAGPGRNLVLRQV